MVSVQSLQASFLNALRKQQLPVSIFLTNGIKLQGQVIGFDQYVIILKSATKQMIFKHAVATIVPSGDIALEDDDFEEDE